MAADAAALARLTEYLQANRDNQPVNRSIIRVSSAGECSRKIGYRLLGFAGVIPTVNELVTFEVGHAYHHMLQDWLMKIGWVADPSWLEFPLADPLLRVRGSCDGITVRLNAQGEPDYGGTRRLIEIKSITNVAQERYGKESVGAFTRLEKPRDYHLDQANTYADLWNKLVLAHLDDPFLVIEERLVGRLLAPNDLISHVTMIYVGKDTSEMPIKVFTQAISQRRIDRLAAKFGAIWQHLDREELPPRDYDPFKSFPPCSFCPYQPLCISEGQG